MKSLPLPQLCGGGGKEVDTVWTVSYTHLAISREEGESIRLLASVLQEHKTESNSMADALQDYEEYVEDVYKRQKPLCEAWRSGR